MQAARADVFLGSFTLFVATQFVVTPRCIAEHDSNIHGRVYMSWSSVVATLKLTRAPTFLKMDIEGICVCVLVRLRLNVLRAML
jgi:hypothetical protein